ncbi:acyl-CoA N-acyltransferase [Russula compacta]|nr:acyl-CoA N-acyltransferase [Russula compacta]
MSYTNSCKPYEKPAIMPECYGPDPYDLNFLLPIHEATLESDRVKLIPFIPSQHMKEYAEQAAAHPELHRYFLLDLSSLDKILTHVELEFRRAPTSVCFAIIDKARGGAHAGVIGVVNASPLQLSVEIAWVVVFPAFQRTYVTTNAVGLLLNYCLELPSAPERPGLGFRRAQWTAHVENERSRVAAKRMGFKEEAVMRWIYLEVEEVVRNVGDSVMLSFCAEDWEKGGREHVRAMIERRE